MNYKLNHNRNLSAKSGVSRLNKQIQKTYALEQRVIKLKRKEDNKRILADIYFFKKVYGDQWKSKYNKYKKQVQ